MTLASSLGSSVSYELRFSPGVANDRFCTTNVRMTNDDWLSSHVHGSGGGSLSDCSGILVICVDEELFAHTAAEAPWDFSHFEIFHESEIDELSLVYRRE